MSGNVHYLAYKVQPWNFAALHGFGGQFIGIHTSDGHFGFLISLGIGRDEFPIMNLALELGHTMVGPR